MKKELNVIFLIAATLVGTGCRTWHAQEPSVQNKRLTEWLKDYALFSYWTPEFDEDGTPIEWSPPLTREEREAGNKAREALQQMGTNAIPSLMRMLLSNKKSESELAEAGFNALGPAARAAVPALLGMLETNFTLACSTLGAIGPAAEEATPALLKRISPTNGPPALSAMQALSRIHGQPELAVPALTQQLVLCGQEPAESFWAELCLMGLAGYGQQAQAAIPAIEVFLNSPDEHVRLCATNTLKRVRKP